MKYLLLWMQGHHHMEEEQGAMPKNFPYQKTPRFQYSTLHYLKKMCQFWHVFFTLNWLTLTRKTHFVQFCLKVAPYLLLGQKIRMWHWGWGCYENTQENQNWYTRIRFIFCSPKYSEFEPEILGLYWEKYKLSFDTQKRTSF